MDGTGWTGLEGLVWKDGTGRTGPGGQDREDRTLWTEPGSVRRGQYRGEPG